MLSYCFLHACRRGVTEIEKSNARRLKQQLPDMDEDPASAPWREKAFNFYDKRYRLLGCKQRTALHAWHNMWS